MSAAWPVIPLGKFLAERREAPSDIDLLSGKTRIVDKVSFNDGRIHLRQSQETKTGMILVRPGDILVSGINAAKGAIAIHDAEASEPLAATIHYGAYQANEARAHPKFLWWLLRSNFFRDLLARHVPGGIKTELKSKRLLPIPVPLPPLAEQRRIVARIEELAAKVEGAQNARRDANREFSALYAKQLFTAFNTVADSKTTIGAEFVVTTGGTPSRSNPSYWGGMNAWVSSGEVAFRAITDTREKITDLGLNGSNAKIYPPGTVLLAMIGQGKTRGQCAILECPAATNQNVAAIHVTKTSHSSRFVYWWLFANYQKSRATETGTAQPALSADRVKQMAIPLPARDQQEQIVAQLDILQLKVDAVKKLQTETATELDAMLPAILDKAFKGDL